MRLIDADELAEWSEIVPLTWDGGIDINDFEEKLKSMPTVDAVSIIRCRDCKHYAGDGMYCSWNMIARPEGYCFHANEGPVYSDD